jgi:hypothetical protein
LVRRCISNFPYSCRKVEEGGRANRDRANCDGLDGDPGQFRVKHPATHDGNAGKRIAEKAKKIEHSRFIEVQPAQNKRNVRIGPKQGFCVIKGMNRQKADAPAQSPFDSRYCEWRKRDQHAVHLPPYRASMTAPNPKDKNQGSDGIGGKLYASFGFGASEPLDGVAALVKVTHSLHGRINRLALAICNWQRAL